MKVAALFVQDDGPYAESLLLPDVDLWPEARDARTYNGPLPVVAHPPCQLWGNLASVNYSRYGGDHNRPGNDGGCFKSAKESVEKWGGVLEHPAGSRAFKTYGIKRPQGYGWQRSGRGWVCEVWQSAYGHRARKATWLYYCGKKRPFDLRWERKEGTHQIGFRFGTDNAKPTLSKRESNATPVEFRDALIRLATESNKILASETDLHQIAPY